MGLSYADKNLDIENFNRCLMLVQFLILCRYIGCFQIGWPMQLTHNFFCSPNDVNVTKKHDMKKKKDEESGVSNLFCVLLQHSLF